MIWDQEHEGMPREQLTQLQFSRLTSVLERVYQNVPFYQKALRDKGITPQDIRSLEDLSQLPFISKYDLRENYPFKLFAVPLRQVVRIHTSSGTTGKPVVAGYTRNDLSNWTELMARTLTSAGVWVGDIVQNAYGYGLFTGGLGFHYGAEKIGATVIPTSGGLTERQVMLMQDFGTTVLCCTPSYSLTIAEVAQEMKVDIPDLKLRVGLFGAEPWSDQMRVEIEQRLHLKAVDVYGLTEVIGPGVSAECEAQAGLHIYEDHFIPEIIDPITGESLPDGQTGELVFTTLTKEAFPVIRFRTRDITQLTREVCACGRTLARMNRVTGRTDDMLIIRGVNVFPSQIESILMKFEEIAPQYQLIVRREGHLDTLTIYVEAIPGILSGSPESIEAIQKKIQDKIQGYLGISVNVRLVEPKSIERSIGKAKRVIDERAKV